MGEAPAASETDMEAVGVGSSSIITMSGCRSNREDYLLWHDLTFNGHLIRYNMSRVDDKNSMKKSVQT